MSGSAERGGSGLPGDGGGARARIMARVTRAMALRDRVPHPGRRDAPTTPDPVPSPRDPVATFVKVFTSQGGEVVRPDPERSSRDWLTSFLTGLEDDVATVAPGEDLPPGLRPRLPTAAPEHAGAGISMAWGAAADTGSLILPSTGSRAVQLLPPVHVVWVLADRVFARLEDALLDLQPGLPAAAGLHSGPSKSADIGRTVVTGVHGPARCIAALLD